MKHAAAALLLLALVGIAGRAEAQQPARNDGRRDRSAGSAAETAIEPNPYVGAVRTSRRSVEIEANPYRHSEPDPGSRRRAQRTADAVAILPNPYRPTR